MKKQNRMSGALLAVAVTAAALTAAGCRNTSSVRYVKLSDGAVSSGGEPVAGRAEARNWGLYLFNCPYLPLFSGQPKWPNKRAYRAFGDNVSVGIVRAMLEKYASENDFRLADIEYEEDNTGFFSLWLIWRRQVTVSGLLISDEEK